MASFLSDVGTEDFRAVLQRAASSGPFALNHLRVDTRLERLCFVADCVNQTILPRRIEFTIAGRRVLSLGARDSRLICMAMTNEPSHTGEDKMEPCPPEELAKICDRIDAALKVGGEVSFRTSAFEASADTRGIGIAATDLFAAAESSPVPLSPIEALEELVARHSAELVGVYYGPQSPAETKVAEEVPDDVARWVEHRLSDADTEIARAQHDELSLLIHPSGHCLALVGHIAEPLALLFEGGTLVPFVEGWNALRSTPRISPQAATTA